jgi:Fe-S cluster biogenesis protein NfuA
MLVQHSQNETNSKMDQPLEFILSVDPYIAKSGGTIQIRGHNEKIVSTIKKEANHLLGW